MSGGQRPRWTVRAHDVLTAMRGGAAGQAVLFAVIGGLATAVNAVVYLLLRGTFPTGLANVLALLLTTIGSSLLHKRIVFTGLRERPLRMHSQTAATFLFYCVSSSAALVLLGLVDDDPGSVAEALAVAAMSTVGGVARFAVLRLWVFRRARRAPVTGVVAPMVSVPR